MVKRWIGVGVLLLVAVVAVAQDGLQPPGECDRQTIIDDLNARVTALDAESETFLQDLYDLQAFVGTERFLCAGLTLSGEPVEGKSSVVLGPIAVPDGIYRLTLTTTDTALITTENLDGRCRFSFGVVGDEAASGAEQILESEDACSLLLEVEARAPWTLVFEPLG